MPILDLTEYQAQMVCFAIRRGIKKLQADKQYNTLKYGDAVMPEILEGKDTKIRALREVAEKLRFELDV